MELRAIATLRGKPPLDFQRTSVHVTLKIENRENFVRYDLGVLGDIRKAGAPDWKTGDTETGPNWYTSGEFSGSLPEGLPPQALRAIADEIRTTLEAPLRRIAKSEAEGMTTLVFVFGGVEETLASFPSAPPVEGLTESVVAKIGTELQAFVDNVFVLAGFKPMKQAPVKLSPNDETALRMYKAGALPLRPEALHRLCQRLGVPVPAS